MKLYSLKAIYMPSELVILSVAKRCHPERKRRISTFRSFALLRMTLAPDDRRALQSGFTLMEILIALFVFSIVSLMLATSLHHIISLQSATEKTAARLRAMQMTLVLLSHDIGQAMNRPVVNTNNHEEAALIGDEHKFSLTHDGLANPLSLSRQSSLSRTQYYFEHHQLWYARTEVLDAAPHTKIYRRMLLDDVQDVQFSYLSSDHHFVRAWPYTRDQNVPLPRGISVTITLNDWGRVTQLYLLPQTTDSSKSNEKS